MTKLNATTITTTVKNAVATVPATARVGDMPNRTVFIHSHPKKAARRYMKTDAVRAGDGRIVCIGLDNPSTDNILYANPDYVHQVLDNVVINVSADVKLVAEAAATTF